ncbi:hypothetical protein BSNK01_07620 [Bacillaceae bacterium]
MANQGKKAQQENSVERGKTPETGNLMESEKEKLEQGRRFSVQMEEKLNLTAAEYANIEMDRIFYGEESGFTAEQESVSAKTGYFRNNAPALVLRNRLGAAKQDDD